jgi:8-oxo-dGTP pyrophosphatase MutT (NUDIX family)
MDSILGVSEGGLDYCSAAIRELFEEIGILLARREDGQHLTDNREIQALRTEIYQGNLAWPDFLQQHELSLACDSLQYFAHWITPSQQPKRWSTRFFLARLPAGQTSRPDGHELTDSRWLTATEALSSGRDGSMKIPFPTFKTLETLAEYDSIEAMLDWAHDRVCEGIHETKPVLVTEDGTLRIFIPDRPGPK